MDICDLNGENIFKTFYDKKCKKQAKNNSIFNTETREIAIELTSNARATTIHSLAILILKVFS